MEIEVDALLFWLSFTGLNTERIVDTFQFNLNTILHP